MSSRESRGDRGVGPAPRLKPLAALMPKEMETTGDLFSPRCAASTSYLDTSSVRARQSQTRAPGAQGLSVL